MNDEFKKILERISTYQENISGVQHNQSIIEIPHILDFLKIHINNLGDPFCEPDTPLDPHSFPEERVVIMEFAKIFKLDPELVWGYCCSCGSEGNLNGIRYGQDVLVEKYNIKDPSNITLIFSKAAHYSIPRTGRMLKLALQEVDIGSYNTINTALFEELILANRDFYTENGVILVLTLGTTMHCGYDDVMACLDILNKYNITKRFVHIDGALGGLIAPLLKEFSIDYSKVDSIAVSGHKILGLPFPAGIFLTKREYWNLVAEYTPYVSHKDGTLFGSRNGLIPLYLYQALQKKNISQNVKQMIDLAAQVVSKLNEKNIPADIAPQGLAIILPSISKQPGFLDIQKKYKLADDSVICHFYVMEHHLNNQKILDEFIQDCCSYYHNL